MKSNRWNYIFITIASLAMLIFMYFTNDISTLLSTLKAAKISWLLLGIFCMVIYWLLESGVLYCTANSIRKKLSFIKAVKTTMVGQLFNNITPFASGGQPMQLYCLTQETIPLGEASSILLMKFIVYQGALVIYSTLMLIGRFNFFQTQVSKLGYLVFIGFTVNLIVIIGLFLVGFLPKFTTMLAKGIILLMSKIHIIKNKEKTTEKVIEQIAEFHAGFKLLMMKKRMLFRATLFTTLQLTMFFLVPYCICMALKIPSPPLFSIIAASSFVLMISSFVPLPGASGGAEGSFYLFFGIFFVQSGILAIAILFWRLITFYLPIFIGIFFCRFTKRKKATVTTT